MVAWHTYAERRSVVLRTLGMGRKDFRVSWVPTMTRFLSMPAREVTREGLTGEQMGAAIRSQRINSPLTAEVGTMVIKMERLPGSTHHAWKPP